MRKIAVWVFGAILGSLLLAPQTTGHAAQDQQPTQEEIAQQMQTAGAQLGAAFAGLGQAMSQAMGTPAGNEAGPAIEPIDFRKFQEEILLKQLGGMLSGPRWDRVKTEGENTTAMGFAMSHARADYRNQDGKLVSIELQDLGNMSGLGGFAANAWAGMKIDRESDDRIEKTFTYKNKYKAYEDINKRYGNARVSVLLGEGRFMLDGNGDDAQLVRSVIDNLNVDKVDGWKDVGAAEQQ